MCFTNVSQRKRGPDSRSLKDNPHVNYLNLYNKQQIRYQFNSGSRGRKYSDNFGGKRSLENFISFISSYENKNLNGFIIQYVKSYSYLSSVPEI